MTHKVPVKLIGDYVASDWYLNSMEVVKGLVRNGTIDMQMLFDAYQVVHGVRMHVDNQGWITHVEFRSEQDAIEFMLKWS